MSSPSPSDCSGEIGQFTCAKCNELFNHAVFHQMPDGKYCDKCLSQWRAQNIIEVSKTHYSRTASVATWWRKRNSLTQQIAFEPLSAVFCSGSNYLKTTMTKYFCDKCEAEITDKNECVGGHISSGRVGTEIKYRTKDQEPLDKSHTLKVEIIHTHDGTANAGLFCKYCILDAFAQLDDRPRQAQTTENKNENRNQRTIRRLRTV